MKRQIILGIVVLAVILALLVKRFGPRYRHESSSSGLAGVTEAATRNSPAAQRDSSTSATAAPNTIVVSRDEQPQETSNGSVTLESLLGGLRATINADFPRYRVPKGKDMTGAWSTGKQPGAPSFLCRGDFNGDGTEDVAVILIGEPGWRLVIFDRDHQGQYRPAFVARPKNKEELGKYSEQRTLSEPQQVLLRTVKKGETWAPEAGDDPNLGPMRADAIELVAKPVPNAYFASLIMFKEGKYQQVYLDPLVELPID